VSCAETDEPIDLLFWVWIRVANRSTSSIVFARWCQCAQWHSTATSAKMAEPVHLPFGLWTQVGRRKHKFSHIRQVAPICPHWRTHWLHLANTTEPSVCSGDVKLLWPLCHFICLIWLLCMELEKSQNLSSLPKKLASFMSVVVLQCPQNRSS